jgi:hypothetical protein
VYGDDATFGEICPWVCRDIDCDEVTTTPSATEESLVTTNAPTTAPQTEAFTTNSRQTESSEAAISTTSALAPLQVRLFLRGLRCWIPGDTEAFVSIVACTLLGRKEGRKEGRNQGRRAGRKEGRKEGRTEGRKESMNESRKE